MRRSMHRLLCAAAALFATTAAMAATPHPDPVGDAIGKGATLHDITGMSLTVTDGDLCIEVFFAGSIQPPSTGESNSVVGDITLDLDVDGMTGFPPLQNAFPGFPPLKDFGGDLSFDLFTEKFYPGQVQWFAGKGGVGGMASIEFTDTSFKITLPLSDLAGLPPEMQSPPFAGTAIVGTFAEPTDAMDSAAISKEAQPFPALALAQVDYYVKGALVVEDSEWGQLDFEFVPAPDFQFLNVVISPGAPEESWPVENVPLPPDFLVGPDPFCSTTFFDLGVDRGDNITGTQLDIALTVSTTPIILVAEAANGERFLVDVGRSQDIINDGVPSNDTTLNAPVPSTANWTFPFVDFKFDWHVGMPNVIQEQNFCGPGAAANSMHWLADVNGYDLGQTIEQSQSDMAEDMGNENNGNWDDTEVQGKLQFIADHDLPIEVHYTGGVMLPVVGDYTDPNGNGTARNDGAVTLEWLKEQMQRGQDIELMTNTHWVVMEGLLCFNDVAVVYYRDDPYQHGADTTPEEAEDIANRHVSTVYDAANNTINIGNGVETLQAVVAESPTVFGDLNGDGIVNGIDLGLLLGAWGPCPPPCPPDINEDGIVDGFDLALLLGAWTF